MNQTKKEIPGLRFVEYDGAEKTIEAMLLEKVDAALTDYTAGSYLVQQRGATDVHIVYVPKFEKNMTVQIGIKKEWKILRDIFNKALSEIQNDELAKLQKKWFRVEVPYSTFNKTISLTQKEKDFIKEHSDITFGVDANWAPYIIVGEDGKLSGYEIDMLKKIKSLTGLNINIKVGQWSDMVAQAKERKIDGLTTSAYNKEREDFFLFSTLYNKVRYMAAVAPGNPHNIKHINDLKNKTIATQKSNLMMIKIAKKLSNKKPLLANSVTDAYNMIVRDEAQATIATEELWYWIKEKDYRHILPAFSLPEYVGLLYSIRKDWPELKSILDKAINVIPENEKRALKNKWLLIQGPTENSPQIDEGKKIVLNEEEKDWLSKHHTVKVRIVDWAPYTFKYPKPSGISIDYLHYVTKKHGIALDFVSGDNFTWPEVMNDLEKENKFFDLTPLMKRTPERETKFALSDDYVFTPWVIIAKKDRIDITGIDSLKGKTVAVEKGYAIQKRLQQEYPEIKFHEVHWPKEALEAVATGVADGYVGNLANSTYLIRKNGLTNLNVVASSPFGYHSQAMAIRPDWPELASIINKTLKTMSQEEHNAILDKWIHTKDTGSDTQISNSLYLNSSEKNFLKKHGEIQLCADSVWTPIDYIDEDGKYSGVGAEFIQLFSQKIGKKIVNYPAKNWQEVLDAAKEGKCDVVSMIAKTPSRAKYLSFTTPYFSSQNVVVTGEDVSYIEDLSKFTNENFGIIRGFASIELLKKKYPGINLIEVGSVKEGLIKVADKEIFGFIDIIPTIAWHIQKLGLIHLKISGDTGVPLQLGLGVKKEFHELHDIFQKAVDSLTPSEKEMILNRYINVRYEKGFDYTMLYKLLFIGVVLFLFILYHTLQKEKLNKELKQKVKEEVEKSRQKDNMIFHQNKLVSMGEMIENIAHQWRQPLSQINASVLVIDDAMMEKGFESEEIEKELDDIERMTKYMSHTIDDFRSLFAKDKIKENLDLQEVIGTAVSIINSSLKYHRINLTVKNSARNIVPGYKNDLIQVILVILNNAKDVLIQTKKDDPKIVIQTTCDDTMVELKVCDNGGGISEENLDKIFEPYFTTKHKAQGTGLGLYISKIIIEQGMEGKLKVENTKEGVCFNIELKRVDNE